MSQLDTRAERLLFIVLVTFREEYRIFQDGTYLQFLVDYIPDRKDLIFLLRKGCCEVEATEIVCCPTDDRAEVFLETPGVD